MAECWAKCIGGCKGPITGEHIVTEGIWKGDEIGVFGLPWCRSRHEFIGVGNFTKNMLCKQHNSDFSPVDVGGIAAFDTFRQVAKVHNQRALNIESGFRTGRFDVCTYEFNGPLLERWFLKTLINMEMAGDQNLPIGPYLNEPGPACELVEAAYGRRTLEGNAGLYFLAGLGQTVKMEERINYMGLVSQSPHGEHVTGAGFVFYGFRFLLLLDPSSKPETLNEVSPSDGTSKHVPLIHRPLQLLVTVNDSPSQEINVTW